MGSKPPKSVVLFLLIFLLACVLLIENTIAKTIVSNKVNQLFPKQYYEFYKEHYKTVNHLRDIGPQKTLIDYPSPQSLVFTTIGNGSRAILLQGDSWAEQFTTVASSRRKLLTYAHQANVEFTAAGVSSYSPSILTSQLILLRNQFSQAPEIVVAVIDQTDIGDELCRYRTKRVVNDSGVQVVPFNQSDSLEPYNLSYFFEQQELLHSRNSNLIKLLLLAKNKLKILMDGRQIKCTWNEISRPLWLGITNNEEAYMNMIISDYIEQVFKDEGVQKLIFMTTPHRNHLSASYILDIQTLLEKTLAASKYKNRIVSLRISDSLLNSRIANPYISGDIASHLTDLAHSEVFTQALLDELTPVN